MFEIGKTYAIKILENGSEEATYILKLILLMVILLNQVVESLIQSQVSLLVLNLKVKI